MGLLSVGPDALTTVFARNKHSGRSEGANILFDNRITDTVDIKQFAVALLFIEHVARDEDMPPIIIDFQQTIIIPILTNMIDE